MNELESDGLLNDQEGTIEVGMQENAEKPATEAVEQISDRGQKIPGAERPIPKQSNPQDSLDNDQPNSASGNRFWQPNSFNSFHASLVLLSWHASTLYL